MKYAVYLVLIIFLIGCKPRSPEGKFHYTYFPRENENLLKKISGWGKEGACEALGIIEFRNDSCFTKPLKFEFGTAYEIKNDTIFLNSTAFGPTNVGMIIIDSNTISYMGCIFRKVDFEKLQQAETREKASIRIDPKPDSKVLEEIAKGTKVYILEDSNDWVKVRVEWYEGYLKKDILEFR